MKVYSADLAALAGRCRRCGEEARKATPDGGGVSSLCWDCTRIVNAERQYPSIPKATPAELAEFDRTYLWAQMPTLAVAPMPKPKRKRKAARG